MGDSRHAAFPPTRTSLVQLAANPDAPGWRTAWERFFKGYWAPLYAYLRRTGSDTQAALDLLSSFFVRGLEGRLLEHYDVERGRLRSYLLTCLANHRRQALRKERARPDRVPWLDAAGAPRVEPTSDDPSVAFERDWNRTLVDQAIAAVRVRLKGDPQGLALLDRWVLVKDRPPAEALATELGISRAALYTRATRLRQTLCQETERRLAFLSGSPTVRASERDAVLRLFRETQ